MRPETTSMPGAGALVAVVAALMTAAAVAGEGSCAGRTLHVGCSGVEVSVFESSLLVKHDGKRPEAVVLFDQEKQPSIYRSPWVGYRVHERLKIVRPYDGASFPRNIAAPSLRWEDGTGNLWLLRVRAPGWSEPLQVVTASRSWRPDAETWEAIKKSGVETGEWINVEVRGCVVEGGLRVGDEVRVDRTCFRVSKHPTDPIIVYRIVSPLFHGLKTPNIEYREVGTYRIGVFLPSIRQYCTNCHAFPINPELPKEKLNLSIAVRRNVGMKQYRILGLYNFASRGGKTLNMNSFFMSWNPDGTKIAVTGGDSVAVRPLITLETQEFYVRVADIIIVDAETLEARPLPGASEAGYMETLPTWSPDGETIVFARATELGAEFSEKKFDLYRVAYNGGRGSKATPVPGASHNGMSNYAARFSPDGKWIAFNKADYSSLVAPTSDLWILSTEQGAMPRKLECNVDEAGDSHHSWSSNSRWLLFASKRDDGVFSRMYLTEIDERGRASPPVEVPFLEQRMLCHNVPEFLRYSLPIDGMDILDKTGSLGGPDAPAAVAGGRGHKRGGE